MSSIPYDFSREPASVVYHQTAVDEATRRGIARALSKRVHGVFASRKNRLPIPWRNRDEHALFGLLEIDPAVMSFRAMPEQVRFMFGGTPRTHVPTAWVETAHGSVVMDVAKAGGDLHRCLATVYAERGLAYRVVPSKVLHALPRAVNARWLLSHRAFDPDPTVVMDLIAALSGVREARPLGELEAELPLSNAAATVCSMALDGMVEMDLAAVCRARMAVRLAAGAGR